MRRQKSWLDRFSRAARWRLGAKEAEEVIADYREIVGGTPRTEEQLARDLGKPLDAVRPLIDQKAYRVWLAVFIVLAGCSLASGIAPTGIGLYLWQWLFVNRYLGCQLGVALALLGAAGAIVWFRWKGRRGEKLSGAVPVLLAVCLALMICLFLFCWACIRDLEGFLAMWGTMPSLLGPEHVVPRSTYLPAFAMTYSAPLIAAMGVFALVKARIGDRRWVAVYVLAMTALTVSLETLATFSKMFDVVPDRDLPELFRANAVITTLGLIGTGVALC